jgi:hypothetical protein
MNQDKQPMPPRPAATGDDGGEQRGNSVGSGDHAPPRDGQAGRAEGAGPGTPSRRGSRPVGVGGATGGVIDRDVEGQRREAEPAQRAPNIDKAS